MKRLIRLVLAPFRALERETRQRVDPFRWTEQDHERASLAADLATVEYGPTHPASSH